MRETTQAMPVIYENNTPTISAFDLYKYLEITMAFSDWFSKILAFDFSCHVDYFPVMREASACSGQFTDYQITLEMAKEVALLHRCSQSRQARQYFTQLEREWNSPEKVLARALKIAESAIEDLNVQNLRQEQDIHRLHAKANYFDSVLQSKDLITTTQVAKDYGKSAKWLNKKLQELGVQYRQENAWILYQKYADKGYARSKTNTYPGRDGSAHSKPHMYWTQKGRLFIYKLLRKQGILPLIESHSAVG